MTDTNRSVLLTENATPLIENMAEYITAQVDRAFPDIAEQPRLRAIMVEFALDCFQDGARWAEMQLTPEERPSPLVSAEGESLG